MNYFHQLEGLLERSYAPYSGFNVAAIVVTKTGDIYKGVNVESAAYPTTICAERNALHTAVTEGVQIGDISEVHILARNATKILVKAYPCGACRQVIAEQAENDAQIYSYTSASEIEQHSISELLPFAFLGQAL
ncbi:MAG: cytidine deaminase [Gammaproteobacteria bacterium]|nr:cytidine deaminase [bacterium]MCK5697794.1 cytidine deaminase [Gammaproteobacteria bacterium]